MFAKVNYFLVFFSPLSFIKFRTSYVKGSLRKS